VLEAGADVSIGPIISNNQNFWGIYQNRIQSSREKAFSSGDLASFTSANFAIKRSFLEASGGFDERYRYYGFEDRDFLLRLISLGAKISFCPEAAIMHNPDSSLINVCRKMMESGQNSSTRFQAAHPEYYARSLYGKIDCRLRGFPLTAFAMICGPMIPRLALLGNKIIGSPGVSFQIKQLLVKIISGLAYMVGTYHGLKK
jgi:GT2 family glycosyltransferase